MPVSVSVRRKTSKGKRSSKNRKRNSKGKRSSKNRKRSSKKSSKSWKMYGGQEYEKINNEKLELGDKTDYYTTNGNRYTKIGKYKGPGLNNDLVFEKITLISHRKIISSDTPIYKEVE